MLGRLEASSLDEVGVNLWQSRGEVGNGSALALVGLVFNLDGEGVAAPALLQRLPGIPEAGGKVFEFLNEDDVVSPAQFCSSLLHHFYGSSRLRLGHGQ